MVVFTCSKCGESLKKNKVDSHFMFRCRSRPLLTCVDCLKDFNSEEYVSHTKCISEEVRYGEKGFVPKSSANKGERKQAERMRLLREYVQEQRVADEDARKILQRILELENVPYKKPALFNMLRNQIALRRTPDTVLEKVWAVMDEINSTISSARQSTSDSPKVKENNASSQDTAEMDEKKEKKNKKKRLKGDCSPGVQCDDQESGVVQEDSAEIKEEEAGSTLSKKKKKEKRKREKYERELMAVEREANKSVVIGEIESQCDETSNNKKSRKRKHCLMNEESNKENGVDHPSEEVERPKTKKKKKKERGHKNELTCEAISSKEDDEGKSESVLVEGGETVVENMAGTVDVSKGTKSNKFDWTETIIAVLKNKNELSMKRLQKKVLNEYLSSGGSEKSIEKAIAKFKKKVLKIPCIKVKKEMVTLVM